MVSSESFEDEAVGVGVATVIAFVLLIVLGFFLWWISAVARLREKDADGSRRMIINAQAFEDGSSHYGPYRDGGNNGRGDTVENNRRRRSYWGDKDSLLRHPLSAFINKSSSMSSQSRQSPHSLSTSPFHMIGGGGGSGGGGLSLSSHSQEVGTDSASVSFRKLVNHTSTRLGNVTASLRKDFQAAGLSNNISGSGATVGGVELAARKMHEKFTVDSDDDDDGGGGGGNGNNDKMGMEGEEEELEGGMRHNYNEIAHDRGRSNLNERYHGSVAVAVATSTPTQRHKMTNESRGHFVTLSVDDDDCKEDESDIAVVDL